MPPELLAFVRDPGASAAKTRLAAQTDPRFAQAAYEAFLDDLARSLRQLRSLRPVLCVEPATSAPALSIRFGGVEARGQASGLLGERLRIALEASFEAGAPAAMVIGSDAPELGADDFEAAGARLAAGFDAVITPAADGGFVLLGFRRERFTATAFEGIDWSTDRVAAQTLERLAVAGIVPNRLPTGEDVDTVDDLRRLASRLATAPERAPATARFLVEAGWISKGVAA